MKTEKVDPKIIVLRFLSSISCPITVNELEKIDELTILMLKEMERDGLIKKSFVVGIEMFELTEKGRKKYWQFIRGDGPIYDFRSV